MKLLKEVTHSAASWIEYDHLAVQTEAQLQVLPDATVKLVLQYQLDGPACTSDLPMHIQPLWIYCANMSACRLMSLKTRVGMGGRRISQHLRVQCRNTR